MSEGTALGEDCPQAVAASESTPSVGFDPRGSAAEVLAVAAMIVFKKYKGMLLVNLVGAAEVESCTCKRAGCGVYLGWEAPAIFCG